MNYGTKFGIIAIAILAIAMIAVPAMACPPGDGHQCPPGEVYRDATYGQCQNCPYVPTEYGQWISGQCPGGHDSSTCDQDYVDPVYGSCNSCPTHDSGTSWNHKYHRGDCMDYDSVYDFGTCPRSGYVSCDGSHHEKQVIAQGYWQHRSVSAGHYDCHDEGYVSCDGSHHEKQILTPAGCFAVSCPAIPCPEGQDCVDGQCLSHTCPRIPCGEDQTCNGGQCNTCPDNSHVVDNECVCNTGFHDENGVCAADTVGGYPPTNQNGLIERVNSDRLSNAGLAAMLSMGTNPEMLGAGTGVNMGFEASVDNGVSGSRYVRLHDTCNVPALYIAVESMTLMHDYQIYYYSAGDEGYFIKNGQIEPYTNIPGRGRIAGNGRLVLTARNPNTAIHAYAMMNTLDVNTHVGLGFKMMVFDDKGKMLWQGDNRGKRDMSVIFLLDPYGKCIPGSQVENAYLGSDVWFGLPKI